MLSNLVHLVVEGSEKGMKIVTVIICIISVFLLVGLIYVLINKILKLHYENKYAFYVKNFEKLHNDLNTICNNYLKRLSATSNTNLYNASLYQDLKGEYIIIVKKLEPALKTALNEYHKNIYESHKEFKKSNNYLKTIFNGYKQKVNKLTTTLIDHFKNEETIRKDLKTLSKEYEECHNEFVRNETKLEILSDTFFRIFDYIEENIENTNRALDDTDYDKASECVKVIRELIKELRNGLETLPGLCDDINETIPQLINKVENEYNKMKEDNIPVHHLHVTANLTNYRNALKELIDNMSNFEYEKTRLYLDEMIKELNELRENFKKEYDSAELVDSDCEQVYNECQSIEKQFISLRQKIVEIVKYYRIAPTYDGYVDKIQLRINDLDVTKRQLDTYVHSSTKQPYSTLVGKMRELDSECKEIENMINEFNTYIDSLKLDCDKSFELINETYIAVKHSEYLLRELNITSISDKYADTVNHIYSILDRLNNMLMLTPIDVATVNRYSKELITYKTGFVEAVKNYIEQASKAEKNIVIANRVRPSITNFKTLLASCDEDFFKGNFEKANENAELVISKARTKD